tara:strand:+ start:139 stop:345 length:207 start_codon:yes stop_codon:yes gene_type:complete
MSLKSFHIIFIIVSTFFGVFFAYWFYQEWSLTHQNIYLIFSCIGALLCVALIFYSKWFIKEIADLNVN